MSEAPSLIDCVPKDPAENLLWRQEWRTACHKDATYQHAFTDAAMEDVLFWFNGFCWLFEPRAMVKEIPFVTWPHQDPCILTMDRSIVESAERSEPIDVVVDKSRGQGATWMYLMVIQRRWIRDPLFSAGLVTRNEKLVDSSRDPDTLLWKYVWMLEKLPPWMLPGGYVRNLNDHAVTNPVNHATCIGYSATGDVARGGRKSVFALDELGALDWIRAENDRSAMDSTHHVTNCRFLVSTYGADRGAFYEAATEDNDAIKVILDWHDNPMQNRLSYKLAEGGKPEAIRGEEQDEVNKYIKANQQRLRRLEKRGHTIVGKVRSPWYDVECGRPGATPRSVAKELDRNPRGAVGKVFDTEVLDRMEAECVKPPVWRGKAIIDPERCIVTGFVRQEGGPLKLWFKPGLDNMVPMGSYCVGCDISAGGTGSYSSNSVACGVDVATGEQVFEYTIKGQMATRFARTCVALSRWARGAFLGWEATGPTGSAFEREVLEELGYWNVYYRTVLSVSSAKYQKRPGWWNGSDDDKGLLFERLCMAMAEDRLIPRSADFIRECGEYEWDENSKIIHAPTKIHATSAGKAHGDRCIAGGVAWLLCSERLESGLDRLNETSQNPPYGCWAWREARDNADRRKWTDDEPQPTLRDILRN